MASKQKNRTRASAKSAQKAGQRTSKAAANKKRAQPQRTARKAVASKPKAGSGKRLQSVNTEAELKREFESRSLTARAKTSPRGSQDFEGVSRSEQADFESVDELVEEGNLAEAGAVAGVQEAEEADEREVHTHELPEDDVPEEYLDKD